jgi:hypothetical protein
MRIPRAAAILSLAVVVPLFSFTCDDVPALNRRVHSFVKTQLGKRVGRGECWDLAAQALTSAGAKWDGGFQFGKPVNPQKECVYPGDIIQYTGVRVHYQKGNTYYEEEMDQHTAMVYQVVAKGSFVVAEQNTSRLGRRVGLSDLDLANVSRGRVEFFRPVAQ